MSIKLRTQQIVIDIPRENEDAWIHIMIQEVIKNKNGKVLNIIPRHEFLHRSGGEVITEIYKYHDPILGEDRDISGYGLQLAIQAAVLKWMHDEEGGAIINGELIIKGDD